LTFRAVGEELAAAAARDPGREAVVTPDGVLTYADLDAAASRVAAGLTAQGVRRGDRVSLLLPNSAEMCAAIYGVLRAGAAISPLNPSIKRDKLARVIAHAGAAALLTDEQHLELAQAAAGDVPVLRPSDLDGDELPAPPIDVDLAALLYTSGSTGEPKGVMLSHRNISFVVGSIVDYLEQTAEDRVLCLLPLSFGYGLYQLLASVRVGGTLVLERGLAFPGRLIQLLEDQRVTGLPGVPTIWQVMVSLEGLADRELPHLRFLTNAGAALPLSVVGQVRSTFPSARLFLMYGQTECARVAYLPPERVDQQPESVGIPIPGTEAWVARGDGSEADAGEVGELMVRGSHVMQGYWKDPEGTAERLRPGRWPWERVLATGDLFRRDEQSLLHFVARQDDIIKSRGEKVAPIEVEKVLLELDEVREAAVVGVPDVRLGEAVHAHLALRAAGALDGRAVRRHCADRLEDHMVPAAVVFHDELPRTSNGKLDRRALKDRPAGD
jgi:long-chain acyl-CoA synthetase